MEQHTISHHKQGGARVSDHVAIFIPSYNWSSPSPYYSNFIFYPDRVHRCGDYDGPRFVGLTRCWLQNSELLKYCILAPSLL